MLIERISSKGPGNLFKSPCVRVIESFFCLKKVSSFKGLEKKFD